MSSLQSAIARLLNATSPEDLKTLLDEEPELFTAETDARLADEEKKAAEAGNHEIADAFSRVRGLLRQLKTIKEASLPEFAGARIAAGIIAILSADVDNCEIPPAILTQSFLDTMDSLRSQAKKAGEEQAFARMDRLARRAHTTAAALPAKSRAKTDIIATIDRWMMCDSWQDAKRFFLKKQNELLSASAETVLSLLLKGPEALRDKDSVEFLKEHQSLLARIRAEGKQAIEPAFQELIDEEERSAGAEEDRLRFEDELLAGWTDMDTSRADMVGMDATHRPSQEQQHATLERLAAQLDALPATGRKKLDYHGLMAWNLDADPFAASNLELAYDLYKRVVTAGGSGSTHIQEGLLARISAAEDPSSIPFWIDILDIKRARDQFTATRRQAALASLARLAINKNSDAAEQALRLLIHHANEKVRAEAVHYLGQVYLFRATPLPADIRDEMTRIAVSDSSLICRFNARNVLRARRIAVPLDNPGAVYVIKTTYVWDRSVTRTIEIRSEDTLQQLHSAIQKSVNWGSDHLFSFYLSDDQDDRRYEVVSPQSSQGMLFSTDIAIGEIGMASGHTFSYLFDYGDQHYFDLEVVDIQPRAGQSTYPRVVAQEGKSPAQYGSIDENF